MFHKLISNLPFSPSLITDVSFYAKRVKQEESLRRIGFVFIAFAMFIQMFAVMAPPEPTLAASANDIIRGGFTSKDQAYNHCKNTSSEFPWILNHLGITCQDIKNASTKTIRSTDYGGQLYSMGRIARGPVGKNNKPTDEYAIQIGGKNFYMRKLNSFDTWSSSTYKALVGRTSSGKAFMILYDCGNIVLVGRTASLPPAEKAPAPTPPPAPTPVDDGACEVIAVPPIIKQGEKFNATIRVKNSGTTSWDPSKGYILGSESPRDNMNWGTNRVSLPRAVSPGATEDITHSFTAPRSAGTYQFTWQMLQSGVKWFGASCSKPVKIEIPEIPPPTDVCPEIPGTQTSQSECAPCEGSENDNDVESCLVTAKMAKNNTQNIPDANGTTANPGDNITYTLSVTNTGKIPMKDFKFEEVMVDVLEYADITELGGSTLDGPTQTLKWPKLDLAPGQTEVKSFSITVKNPLPQTPKSASDPSSYDLTMTNVFYGVTVNIHLPGGPGKTTEQVVTTLPSTGPGSSAIIAFALTSIVGYFFARSRLISKELDIIRTDFAQSGGV